jgi:hypothetical protein
MFRYYLGIAKGETCQGNRFGVQDWCNVKGIKSEVKPEKEGKYMMIIVAEKDNNVESFSADSYDELMAKAKEVADVVR